MEMPHNRNVATLFLLVRHGLTDAVGHRITGRLPGVSINKTGEAQAARLADLKADAVFSSPLERAIQTATPLSQRLGLPIHISEAFSEVDFGEWSGLTLGELDALPAWKLFNRFRSSVSPPGGELMLDVQRRVAEELSRLAGEYDGKTVAIFTHADVIKGAVSHYIGAPLDLIDRIEIYPASVTRIRLSEDGVKVNGVNDRAATDGRS